MVSDYLKIFNKAIELNNDMHKVCYIISRYYNGSKKIIAIAHDMQPSMSNKNIKIIKVTYINNYMEYDNNAKLGSSSQKYLFHKLKQGYEIEHISMAFHAYMWDTEHSFVRTNYPNEGVQKYLKYCQLENIDHNILSCASEKEIPNLLKYYQEENQRYKIVAKIILGKESVVLGYNKNAPSEFVTWRKTRNGYDIGHYFSEFKNAWEDYQDRCIDVTRNQVINQKSLSFSKINGGKEYER